MAFLFEKGCISAKMVCSVAMSPYWYRYWKYQHVGTFLVSVSKKVAMKLLYSVLEILAYLQYPYQQKCGIGLSLMFSLKTAIEK